MSSSTALALPSAALPVPLAGSLDAYIQSVSRIPVLEAQEEQLLAPAKSSATTTRGVSTEVTR